MIYAAGVDVGSTQTKAIILDENRKIVGRALINTGAYVTQAAERAFREAAANAGITPEQVSYVVGTGYGRYKVTFGNAQITEISCHARGANLLFPKTRTVIDMGGQDAKGIRVDENGAVKDFVMNDKCAAGTGRFLEVMAERLGVELGDLGRLSLDAQGEVEISSVCTVFAESEVVSLIAKNHPRNEIIRGLHKAIVGRVYAMARALGVQGAVTMTGGVAKNAGVVALMEARLGQPIHVPAEPQIVGALGAALTALRQAG